MQVNRALSRQRYQSGVQENNFWGRDIETTQVDKINQTEIRYRPTEECYMERSRSQQSNLRNSMMNMKFTEIG